MDISRLGGINRQRLLQQLFPTVDLTGVADEDIPAAIVASGSGLAPSGGDDRAAMQAVIDAGRALWLRDDVQYFLGSPGLVFKSGSRLLGNPQRRPIISPIGWAPAVSSANDPTIAMVSAVATVAGSGTTTAVRPQRGHMNITATDASLLTGLAAGATFRLYSSRASGGDWVGDSGSERYEILEVASTYVTGNSIPLVQPVRLMHTTNAQLRMVTTPIANVKICGVRFDASGGSIPNHILLDGATNVEIDVEGRGASNAVVHARFGTRGGGRLIHDGENNCGLLRESVQEFKVLFDSTGRGARFHRNGKIRGLVEDIERVVDSRILEGSNITNGCVGYTGKGMIAGGIKAHIHHNRAREWLRMPTIRFITANASSNVITMFDHGFSPDNETRDGDRIMFDTSTTLPAPLVAGTVYYAVNATYTGFQVALTRGGAPIDLMDTGGSFATMVAAEHLVSAINTTSETITITDHTWVDGDEMWVESESFPGGLSRVTSYWIVQSTPHTFKLSATAGGSPINITSAGSMTCLARNRFIDNRVLSRGNSPRVAGAGININGGNPSVVPSQQERVNDFEIDVTLEDNLVPCGTGAQGNGCLIDAFNMTAKIRMVNRSRSDQLLAPAADDHNFGIIHWDISNLKYLEYVAQGIENACTSIGGWNRIFVESAHFNSTDGVSTVANMIVNGMETPEPSADAVLSQPTSIIFDNVTINGYTNLVAVHGDLAWPPKPYSWGYVFIANNATFQQVGAHRLSWERLITVKNTTGGNVSCGQIVKLSSFTDAATPVANKLPAIVALTDDNPARTAVVVGDPAQVVANNAFCVVALKCCIVQTKAGDVFVPGDLVYLDGTTGKVTTTAGAAAAFGVAVGHKIANPGAGVTANLAVLR